MTHCKLPIGYYFKFSKTADLKNKIRPVLPIINDTVQLSDNYSNLYIIIFIIHTFDSS